MKNLFKKKQAVLICSCIFLTFLICISSCKKESNQKSTSIFNENQKTDQAVVEKVDKQLLQTYVDYELKLEAKNLRSQSNSSIHTDVTDLKMNKFAFEKMINNYLANERNIMREAFFPKKSLRVSPNTLYTPDPQHCYDASGAEIPCPTAGGGSTVSCLGNFTGKNTTNTILFVAGIK